MPLHPDGGSSRGAYVDRYLKETARILGSIPTTEIEKIIGELCALRDRGGRLFFIGSGGGAAHASHAVNDFRKIACFEAYTPSDNASELTARVNDEGWESSYVEWLRGSRLSGNDMVFVFSVGGGDAERNVSANLVRCLEYATEIGAKICGIVGRNGGFTARVADACLVIPIESDERVTPHTEGIQSVVAHLLVSHPDLRAKAMRWESLN